MENTSACHCQTLTVLLWCIQSTRNSCSKDNCSVYHSIKQIQTLNICQRPNSMIIGTTLGHCILLFDQITKASRNTLPWLSLQPWLLVSAEQGVWSISEGYISRENLTTQQYSTMQQIIKYIFKARAFSSRFGPDRPCYHAIWHRESQTYLFRLLVYLTCQTQDHLRASAELLANTVIGESDSPWASSVVSVHHKEKNCFSVDHCKSSKVLRVHEHPNCNFAKVPIKLTV